MPLRDPDDRDYMFVANKILPRENIEEKLLRMQKTPTCASTVNDVSKVTFSVDCDNSVATAVH